MTKRIYVTAKGNAVEKFIERFGSTIIQCLIDLSNISIKLPVDYENLDILGITFNSVDEITIRFIDPSVSYKIKNFPLENLNIYTPYGFNGILQYNVSEIE